MVFTYSLPGGCTNHAEACDPTAALPFLAIALIVPAFLAWRAYRVITRLEKPDPRPVGFFTWYFLVSVVFPLWKMNRTFVLAYAMQFRKRLVLLLGAMNVLALVTLPFAAPYPPGFLATFALTLPAANLIVAVGPLAISEAVRRKGWNLPQVSFWKHHETWLT